MAPRKFSGPIQQKAIQFLRANGMASTSDIMLRTHPRLGSPQDKSKSTRRALAEIAERIGRAEGMGRPVLWRLKPEFQELSCPASPLPAKSHQRAS
jgi:hypothetical protein